MHNTRDVRRQKRCGNRTCLRLSVRFTEPPHRATQVKQPGQGDRSPILVPGKVTHDPPVAPGHRGHDPAPVAQWIEQAPSKRLAAGSSPAGGTNLRSPLTGYRRRSATFAACFRGAHVCAPGKQRSWRYQEISCGLSRKPQVEAVLRGVRGLHREAAGSSPAGAHRTWLVVRPSRVTGRCDWLSFNYVRSSSSSRQGLPPGVRRAIARR